MLKLARNALTSLGSFYDSDGGEIQRKFFHLLHNLQEDEGLNLGNKFSAQHLQFEKHKMNVRLAAQALSSSVTNAIEFLDVSMKRPQFKNSGPTVNFIRNIDRPFDILNSRCPRAKGYKQHLRPKSQDTWEDYLKSTAEYLLSLVGKQGKNREQELLSTHRRKTFIVGFVATIESTINMANKMFSLKENPFAYLLTYKFSQDHIELLFSCIRSKGGWNNNPNSMQLKYALRKMLFTNAVKASKNSNFIDFSEGFSSGIIPILHKRKHRSPLIEEEKPENDSGFTLTEQLLVEQLAERGHSEFMGNILFDISGFIVKKLIKLLACTACRSCLISSLSSSSVDHDYCGAKTTQHSDTPAASAFTLFVNRGGLTIPSQSVYAVVKYAEHIFKAFVVKDGKHINSSEKLRSKMIMEVCHHFVVNESCHLNIFGDHDPGMNEVGLDEDHKLKLI
ncbi:Hypothetical predicted protein, partial [Paramuricea clavata]